MKLYRIISGGQTGADQAFLGAAEEYGVETGGWMPHYWQTEDGPEPSFASRFGMKEHPELGYQPRTYANVRDSDATIIFGNAYSRGSRLTSICCRNLDKPCMNIDWSKGFEFTRADERQLDEFFERYDPGILNGAGNRASVSPGIYDACYRYASRLLIRYNAIVKVK